MEDWTQEYVRSLFAYHDSGWLIWRYDPTKPLNWNRRCIGEAAGSVSGNGYINVAINQTKYGAHRIIFLWHHGYLPERIDHFDDNRANNRIGNLRAATHSQNIFNGFNITATGVERHGAKYRSRIVVDGIRIELGSFDEYDEAKEAYRIASQEYYGEFAR